MIKWINQKLCVFFSSLLTNLALFVFLAFLTRLVMLFSLKDPFLTLEFSEVVPVFIMGLRFDLKIGVVFGALIAIPLIFLSSTSLVVRFWQALLWVIVLTVLVANYGYFSFYGTPFNALVFGLFDDDTSAIMQTLISDFPIIKMLTFVILFTILLRKLNKFCTAKVHHFFATYLNKNFQAAIGYFVLLICLTFMAKGTLAGVALQRQHMVVTNTQFLNDLVPNYVSALYYALSAKKNEPKMSDTEVLVHRLGFSSILEVADILGLKAESSADLIKQLYTTTQTNANSNTQAPPPYLRAFEELNELEKPHVLVLKNGLVTTKGKDNKVIYPTYLVERSEKQPVKDLIFFLMESMGQEPFLYQSEDFDVLGKLNSAKSFACHFDNFDSIQNGTFPTLEGILYHSPITPLTQGQYAYKPMAWSIPASLKNAGYHTVFFTGGRASWRNLDQSLRNQGFDEILDAGYILENYSESYIDMWGVPDEFLFKAISDYREAYHQKQQQTDKPLFIFVLSITNHPPYTLPDTVIHPNLALSEWLGDVSDPLLEKNLLTFRYAANELGQFILEAKDEIEQNQLIIAATGDHNARTFGRYSAVNRRHLANQVPFMVWANQEDCGNQLHSVASHRDMFPTLFELLGANITYFKSGRNLFDDSFDISQSLGLQFTGNVRTPLYQANILDGQFPKELLSLCENESENKVNEDCEKQRLIWQQAKASLALADWHIRYQLTNQ